jgi:hypothetical protein
VVLGRHTHTRRALGCVGGCVCLVTLDARRSTLGARRSTAPRHGGRSWTRPAMKQRRTPWQRQTGCPTGRWARQRAGACPASTAPDPSGLAPRSRGLPPSRRPTSDRAPSTPSSHPPVIQLLSLDTTLVSTFYFPRLSLSPISPSLLSTNSSLPPARYIPLALPANQGVNLKPHSGPPTPHPQRPAFRITQQSRTSLSESTASRLPPVPIFLATPRAETLVVRTPYSLRPPSPILARRCPTTPTTLGDDCCFLASSCLLPQLSSQTARPHHRPRRQRQRPLC